MGEKISIDSNFLWWPSTYKIGSRKPNGAGIRLPGSQGRIGVSDVPFLAMALEQFNGLVGR